MDAVLSVVDKDGWDKWGLRYVARQPTQRRQVLIGPKPSVLEAHKLILQTISAAGPGGTVLFNVGHGGIRPRGTDLRHGSVELCPGGGMKITGPGEAGFVNVFYDSDIVSNGKTQKQSDESFKYDNDRTRNWNIYENIGRAFKSTNIRKVVLLSCNIGGASELLRKVANDWQCLVQAYKGKIEIQTINDLNPNVKTNHVVMFCQNNTPAAWTTAAEIVIHEEEIPYEPSEAVFFGPSLRV